MSATIRNREQAIAEAQRRWGANGFAWILAGVRYVSHNMSATDLGQGWNHFDGFGKTWDAAFADVGKRKAARRLIAEARRTHRAIDHIDGDPTNYDLANLRIVTLSDNRRAK
jgi:hypothetical protein